MNKQIARAISAGLFGTFLGYGSLAGAAGFAIVENSAQGQGDAFASGGAAAEDAASMWFNPATLSKLGSQMQASAHFINPSFEFNDKGSVQKVGAATVTLLPTAGAQEDGGVDALVPNLYYTHKINNKINVGFSVNAPFGLSTAYDPNWKGRYQSVDSRITTITFNPAISYKVNNNLTFGAGVSANYIDARLTNAVDFNAVCLANSGAAAPFCVGGNAPGQGANDGFAEIKADDLSFGFNVGLLYEINNNTRISAAYRSQVNHKLNGTAAFSVPTTLNTVGAVNTALKAAFANTGVKAGVSLPDSFSFSAYHRVVPKLAILADATWTGWSDLPELRIIFDAPTTRGTGFSTETLGFKDSWRLGLGLHYYQSNRLTLRTGVAFDQSPARNAVTRTSRLPDNSRVWLSFGASYKLNRKMSADVGYSHLFVNDTAIARVGSTNNVLNGIYKTDANIFSAQFNYKFN